jgi:hypothetical protein
MPWKDSSTTGGKVRLKHSATPLESIGAAGLRTGEVALNSADGKMLYKSADGSVKSIPGGYTGVISIFDNGLGSSHLLTCTNGILTAYEIS